MASSGGRPICKAADRAQGTNDYFGLHRRLLVRYIVYKRNVQYYDTPPVRNRFSYVSSASERYRPSAEGNTVDDIHNLR